MDINHIHMSFPRDNYTIINSLRPSDAYASATYTNIGSDNGLSPVRRQAIIWNNVGILSIGRLGTNFGEILIEIQIFSIQKMHLKMSSGKYQPFCLGLNVFLTVSPNLGETKLA